jgi:tetratricopeptide (TPR) repeat protein
MAGMDPPDPPPADERVARARALADRAAAEAEAGRPNEARLLLEAALVEGGVDVHVLFRAFQFHFRLGELEPAEHFARRRLAAAGPDTRTPHAARAYTNLGLVLVFRKRFDGARAALARALEIDRAIGFEYGVARDLGNLSLIHEDQGDLDAAEALLREALAIAQRLGAEDIAATKYANLGDIAMRRGQPDAARALWARAVEVFARLGPRRHHDEFAAKIAALDKRAE